MNPNKNKIVLGTMKLKKYFNNSKDLANYLNYAFDNGFRKLHISNEYSSYNLLIKSLEKIKKKKFTIFIKLSEPKKDQIKFSLKRFINKIEKYRHDFGKKHSYIIQLVNRYKCKNSREYLFNEKKTFDHLEDTILKLKKKNIIKKFYFFPYYRNENKIKKNSFIDGITCYRNLKQKKYDKYAKKNKYKIIAMRTLGGSQKLIKNNNLKRLISFNLKSKIVHNVIVGINNKTQLSQLIKIC